MSGRKSQGRKRFTSTGRIQESFMGEIFEFSLVEQQDPRRPYGWRSVPACLYLIVKEQRDGKLLTLADATLWAWRSAHSPGAPFSPGIIGPNSSPVALNAVGSVLSFLGAQLVACVCFPLDLSLQRGKDEGDRKLGKFALSSFKWEPDGWDLRRAYM